MSPRGLVELLFDPSFSGPGMDHSKGKIPAETSGREGGGDALTHRKTSGTEAGAQGLGRVHSASGGRAAVPAARGRRAEAGESASVQVLTAGLFLLRERWPPGEGSGQRNDVT